MRVSLRLMTFGLMLVCGCGPAGGSANDLLTGKITVGGEPAREVIITVTGPSGTAGTMSTDTGEFRIPEPPKGKLKFTIVGAPPGAPPGAKVTSKSTTSVPPKYAGPNELEFDYKGGRQTYDIQLTR